MCRSFGLTHRLSGPTRLYWPVHQSLKKAIQPTVDDCLSIPLFQSFRSRSASIREGRLAGKTKEGNLSK